VEEETKRGRGRPTVGERVSLGLRVTPEMKRQLDTAAEQSGRSQSQEAELRLEHTFDRQGLLSEVLVLRYGTTIAADLMWLGEIMKVLRQFDLRWGHKHDAAKWRRTVAELYKVHEVEAADTIIDEEDFRKFLEKIPNPHEFRQRVLRATRALPYPARKTK
jgi:uncharacterized protein (DUF1778 family)